MGAFEGPNRGDIDLRGSVGHLGMDWCSQNQDQRRKLG
jgi:hypothetical protein